MLKLESNTNPGKIDINEEEVIVWKKKRDYPIPSYRVEKIKDYGKHYLLIFEGKYNIHCCILQKDLIVKGTIEELEAFFNDVIIRQK